MYTNGQRFGTILLDHHGRNNNTELRNTINMKTATVTDNKNVLY